MDPWFILVPVVMLSLVGVIRVVEYWQEENIIRRQIRATPRRLIGEWRDGQIVRITGRVQSVGEPLTAPLSRRVCAYYDAIGEEVLRRGLSELARETRGQPFLVRDRSGLALVDPAGANLVLTYGLHGDFGKPSPGHPSPEELASFLARQGIEHLPSPGPFTPQRLWREGALVEGEVVTVVGQCQWQDSPATTFREPGRLLLVAASGSQRLLITDERREVFAPLS